MQMCYLLLGAESLVHCANCSIQIINYAIIVCKTQLHAYKQYKSFLMCKLVAFLYSVISCTNKVTYYAESVKCIQHETQLLVYTLQMHSFATYRDTSSSISFLMLVYVHLKKGSHQLHNHCWFRPLHPLHPRAQWWMALAAHLCMLGSHPSSHLHL